MTKRTDIHAPSSEDFSPELYDCYGVFDNHPEWPDVWATKLRRELINKLIEDGYRCGHGGSSNCGHCGARIRYAALMVRDDVKQWIYVGETCLDNRFELEKGQFQALRKASALRGLAATATKRVEDLVAQYPTLVWLTYLNDIDLEWNEFTDSIAEQLIRKGELSEAQISGAVRFLDGAMKGYWKLAEIKAAKAAQKAAGEISPAPAGKQIITGKIVSTKAQDSQFGTAFKMVVEDDRGFKVWSTIPSALISWQPDWLENLRGQRVTFSATLEISEKDEFFSFARRPTKAQIVEV